MGDQLLKEYSNFFIEKLENEEEVFFTRVVSDQFLLLIPYKKQSDFLGEIDRLNKEFEKTQSGKFPGAKIHLRTGVYIIEPGCPSASFAIDAANEARKQITKDSAVSVKLYDGSGEEKMQGR